MEHYKTIRSETSARLTRKGSRFLALAFPVASPEEVEVLLRRVKRRYHDATHHCYAYRLITKDTVVARADDAGEPAGSAGPPILHILESQDLLNVLVVVVRYFGGTKLGLGGLSRAYADATREALARAEIAVRARRARLQLRYPAELTGEVLRLVNQYHAAIEAQTYEEGPRLTVSLPRAQLEPFRLALREATSGRIEFAELEG